MNKKEKDNIVGVMAAVAFAGFCLGAGLANHCNHLRNDKGKVTVDTVTVRDTVRITEPRAADSVVTGVIRVPVALPTEPTVPKAEIEVFEPGRLSEVLDGHTGNDGDSKAQETGKFARKDTVWAVVPRTQKRYEDSTYMAWVSGYEPRLDSIEVYQKTVVVTKSVEGRVKNRRFNVGLTGGFGYGVFTRKLDVWVGVGCTWRMF